MWNIFPGGADVPPETTMTTYIFNRNRTLAELTAALAMLAITIAGLFTRPWMPIPNLWVQAAFSAVATVAAGMILLNIVPYLLFLFRFQIAAGDDGLIYRQLWSHGDGTWDEVDWQRTFSVGTVLYVRGRMLVIPAFLPGYRSLMETIREGCGRHNPPIDSESQLARTVTGVAIRHGDAEAVATLQQAARVDSREAKRLLEWLRFSMGRLPKTPPLWIIYITIAAYYAIVCVPLTMFQYEALAHSQTYQYLNGDQP